MSTIRVAGASGDPVRGARPSRPALIGADRRRPAMSSGLRRAGAPAPERSTARAVIMVGMARKWYGIPIGRRFPGFRSAARSAGRFAAERVRSAPGTHVWLAVLAVTSVVIAVVSPSVRTFLLHHNSTNLVQLRKHPVRVLIVSALWIQSPSGFLVYLVLFEAIHAPAERWLGTARWLLTAALAHVGATLLSERAVQLGIHYDQLPRSMAHTIDIGVSYGLAGVLGVLVYLLPRRLRRPYAVVVTGFFAWALATSRTYTDLGHLTALLIGFGCYGLTPAPRGPAAARRPSRRWRRGGGSPPDDGSAPEGGGPHGGRPAVHSRGGSGSGAPKS